MKKECAISHNNSNLKSCHNLMQLGEQSSEQELRAPKPLANSMRERQLYWQNSIILVLIPGSLIHMVQHWWDALKQEQI